MPHEQAGDRRSLGHSTQKETGAQADRSSANGAKEGPPPIRADRDEQAIQGRDDGHHHLAPEKAYLVETDEGIFRVTVPADWLITFGPMFVSTKRSEPTPRGSLLIPTALRFYEGKHQRACMLNVTNFHDLSIKIEAGKMVKGEFVNG